MRLQDLFEKRSNPELNPKIEPLDQLRRCVAQHGDDLFVSFTQGFGRNQYPKLGVNPRSSFKTPIGIYCYRASVVIQHTEMEQESSRQYGDDNGGLTALFTGDQAWHNAWIVKLDQTNALRAPLNPVEYAKKVEILKTMWKGSDDEFLEFVDDAETTANERKHIWYYWNATRLMTEHLSSETKPRISVWNQVLRKCGYTMAIDDGMGWIHANESEQAVVFDPRIIKPVDIIKRAEGKSILHYGMKKRADQDPLLVLRLPPEAIERLASPMAMTILENYLDHAHQYGITPSVKVGIGFLDNLSGDVCADISDLFANERKSVASMIGWHGVFKTKRYYRLNRRGIRGLLNPDLRYSTYPFYKIDEQLAQKIASLFYYDAALVTLDNESEMMAESVIKLLQEPDRFVNFQHFVTLFADRDRLEGRYLEVSKIADSIISKDA